jgi:phosphatidylserine/phosphatidylglycerophosphate/cardiolipin synthase-like enzyme
MSVLFPRLAPAQLEAIADVVERSRDSVLDRGALAVLQLGTETSSVVLELQKHTLALGWRTLVAILRAVATERHRGILAADRRLELVWTGPERDGTATRDTAVVVRELFQSAERDVLIAGYALFNAWSIFEPLADRMASRPALRVRLFINVPRADDSIADREMTREFARRLRSHHWPHGRLPEVYFDPRSLERRSGVRAVMHAKCVLVDDCRVFITSANLTEAAQARNIELGVVVNDGEWCRAVRQQFDDLVDRGDLRRLPDVG